jgi:uncharacterized protein with ParB-like and HNH nuclease domain
MMMEGSNLLDTKTVNSHEVLGNGKRYFVPLYQRDYAWQEHHWEDLWADILAIEESKKVHYLGAIVLQNKGNKNFAVIDGQQRLSTITIMALACIKILKDLAEKNIEKAQNEERIQILSAKFIGEKEPTSLIYSSKLQLNQNNNLFFQMNLLTLKRPHDLVLLKLNESDKLLFKAYNFFYACIQEHFATEISGEKIAHLLNQVIGEKLIFTQIIVDNELQAYTVFETLNSRGMALSISDLIKNYLFSLASPLEILPVISQKWEQITASVGLDRLAIFLRHYWIAKNKLVRQEHIFRNIKAKITNTEDLLSFLEDLEKFVIIYAALHNSADELWRGNKAIKKGIKELEIFEVTQGLPLLLITYDKIPHVFEKVLQFVTVISFRATVIGKQQNKKLEETYNKVALGVANGEIATPLQIAEELKDLYVRDVDFKNDFSTISFHARKNKKLLRYILFELENQLANNGSLYDFEDNAATIEHILPENAGAAWEQFFPKQSIENYVCRLGNYTLLEESKNKEIGNALYEAKQIVFKTSNFVMTKQIDFAVWNSNNLDKRQINLAKMATAIWKLLYFANQ